MQNRVINIIKKYSMVDNINSADRLKNIGIDSLMIVEVILELEEELHIEFDIEKLSLDNLKIVSDIIKLCSEKML